MYALLDIHDVPVTHTSSILDCLDVLPSSALRMYGPTIRIRFPDQQIIVCDAGLRTWLGAECIAQAFNTELRQQLQTCAHIVDISYKRSVTSLRIKSYAGAILALRLYNRETADMLAQRLYRALHS